jgi:hypothetical protein
MIFLVVQFFPIILIIIIIMNSNWNLTKNNIRARNIKLYIYIKYRLLLIVD